MKDIDVFVIYWWNKEDGSKRYRCRGIGPTYDKFYDEWVPNSSYINTSDDWPWDFFKFGDSQDHEKLIRDFGKYVFEDKDDD